MKILISYAIILEFFTSFCNCSNFTVAVDPYHKEIYKFVKNVIIDWNQEHENDINDISIINMDNDTSLLLHIVRKAAQQGNSVLLPDCSDKDHIKYSNTRVSSLIIVIVRIQADLVFYSKRLFKCIDSGFWSTDSNLIVIPSTNDADLKNIKNLCTIFTTTRMVSFIIPHIENGKITSIHKSGILRRNCTSSDVTYDTSKLFSSNLNGMNGYTYTAIGNKADNSLSMEIQLIKTIAKSQNAQLNVSLMEISSIMDLRQEIGRGLVDMILNIENFELFLNRNNIYKKINTFETNGYCPLVPIADHTRSFFQVTVHPFSRRVWFCFFLSILSATLVWLMYRKFSRHRTDINGCIAIDIVSAFLQRSVNTHEGPIGLKIMIQLFIFMMIVIGNVYQGTITSALMDHRVYNNYSNDPKGLFSKQNYDFYADDVLIQRINDSKFYNHNFMRIKSLDNGLSRKNYIKKFQNIMTVKPKNVLVVRCDTVQKLLNTQIDKNTKAYDVYTEFPRKMFNYYKNILLTRRSPFYERLNKLTLRIQESGIKQYWKMQMKNPNQLKKHDNNDKFMLDMKDIIPVLILLFHGYYLAGYTCIFEILWFKIIKSFVRLIYRRWIKKFLRAVHKYRNRKVRPRIQKVVKVSPSIEEDDMSISTVNV